MQSVSCLLIYLRRKIQFKIGSYISYSTRQDDVCEVSEWCVLHRTLDGAVHSLIQMHDSPQAAQIMKLLARDKPPWQDITDHKLKAIKYSHLYYLAGFFDDAKTDFQQALKLNPDFEDAKLSLQQTLVDEQRKINRGYWQPHKLLSTYYVCISLGVKKRDVPICRCT